PAGRARRAPAGRRHRPRPDGPAPRRERETVGPRRRDPRLRAPEGLWSGLHRSRPCHLPYQRRARGPEEGDQPPLRLADRRGEALRRLLSRKGNAGVFEEAAPDPVKAVAGAARQSGTPFARVSAQGGAQAKRVASVVAEPARIRHKAVPLTDEIDLGPAGCLEDK